MVSFQAIVEFQAHQHQQQQLTSLQQLYFFFANCNIVIAAQLLPTLSLLDDEEDFVFYRTPIEREEDITSRKKKSVGQLYPGNKRLALPSVVLLGDFLGQILSLSATISVDIVILLSGSFQACRHNCTCEDVIAESADNCIKTMLRNCKVACVLPRIGDCAKNDRNAVLPARCDQLRELVIGCLQKPGQNVPGIHSHLLIPSFKGSTLCPQELTLHQLVFRPPFPLAVPSSSHLMDSVLADSTASNISRGSSQSSGLITSDLISAQVHASKDPRKFSYRSSLSTEPFVILYCQENF
ncbi:hypothetical protein IFM89_026971 [Coptis chinensis]|uniref:Uncharacterized protein n=1 Tax=Coptis chinensis TaxID=261450 RepID=A0A835I6M1_9MAGN|nr:hypothetical protein IFM89_026971 [Coptis chinensis]